MDLFTKMGRVVKINNKKYYKVKADETKFMLFKSKDDCNRNAVLEKMVLSRMKSIEEYLKTLCSTKIRIIIFDKKFDYNGSEPRPDNYEIAFDIVFPFTAFYLHSIHIYRTPWSYSISSGEHDYIYGKLETEAMKDKFRDLSALINDAIEFNYK